MDVQAFLGSSVSPARRSRRWWPSLAFVGLSLAAAGVTATDGPLAALDHGLRPTVVAPGEHIPRWSIEERMRFHKVPGVAVAVLKNGRVAQVRGYGVKQAGTSDRVDADTLFSVGSISKVVTATTTLRLAAQGTLDLDRDVDAYLKRWKLPASPAVPHPEVSLRMLMSHTSGLGVHGFADYQPADPLPTLVQVLDGQRPAKGEAVRFKAAPGSVDDYSGGGVTVEQMAIEDATGRPLADVARDLVLTPLGMRRSTYESPLSATRGNIAKAHDASGAPTALPRGWESFAEAGASGLWTSANDLGRFIAAIIGSYRGTDSFLPQPLATDMLTEVSPGPFGLGPRLGGEGRGRYFFHLGANESYLALLQGYPETGDGYVILTNGANGLALIAEVRNALDDATGLSARPPVMTIKPRVPPAPDFAGTYRLDASVPIDVRRALADSFEHASLDVTVKGDDVSLTLPGQEKPVVLQALGPAQFVQSGIYVFRFEFRRDAFGKVRGLTVSMPETESVAYYTKDVAPEPGA
ncbi:serine hydrolase domain-containing protein [Luteibacter sp. 329MFSha]|uniref:serine hydrolase domain-containing protein n=1 Tax=Luteibacter sp. 329MFSha TaxID=1798239 RepID=UPI0008D2B343|nr:serine hydrolase domain-containing protein [Luteibacter sp. 329MFSha]SEW20105.1 CubicO group peptidase, beta-lactamase class C family [Luteibacter sp. 329MFSha]